MQQLRRIFFGIPVSQIIALNFERYKITSPAIRWLPVASLHITIKYLGEQSERVILDIQDRMSNIKLHSTTITLGDMKIWQPNMLVIAINPNTELQILKDSIDLVLSKNGVTTLEHKEFMPHITIARVKKSIDHSIVNTLINEYNSKNSGYHFVCNQYSLYESKVDGSKNRVYEQISIF